MRCFAFSFEHFSKLGQAFQKLLQNNIWFSYHYNYMIPTFISNCMIVFIGVRDVTTRGLCSFRRRCHFSHWRWRDIWFCNKRLINHDRCIMLYKNWFTVLSRPSFSTFLTSEKRFQPIFGQIRVDEKVAIFLAEGQNFFHQRNFSAHDFFLCFCMYIRRITLNSTTKSRTHDF